MSDNFIIDAGMLRLMNGLCINNRLTYLYMVSFQITDESIQAIENMVKFNKLLTKLGLLEIYLQRQDKIESVKYSVLCHAVRNF